jgi:hypothetical protein
VYEKVVRGDLTLPVAKGVNQISDCRCSMSVQRTGPTLGRMSREPVLFRRGGCIHASKRRMD